MSNFIALVVEDDPLQREFLADLLKGEGLEVVECASAGAAELVARKSAPFSLPPSTAGVSDAECSSALAPPVLYPARFHLRSLRLKGCSRMKRAQLLPPH